MRCVLKSKLLLKPVRVGMPGRFGSFQIRHDFESIPDQASLTRAASKKKGVFKKDALLHGIVKMN
jgi:hypothetical protein